MEAPRLLVDARNETGESPVWDDANQRLLWCDIPAGLIFSYEPRTQAQRRWTLSQRVGSFGLCESGRWVLGLADGVYLYEPESQRLELLVPVEADVPRTRLNDGKVGPDGAFWVGSMDEHDPREPIASLYRVTPDGRAERKIEGLIVSNGLAWTPDGRTMIHTDSRQTWIDAWDFDVATGAISNRRRLRTQTEEEGRPDGGACDAEGCYWSAGVSAGRLNRFSITGELLRTVPLPMAAPTMPCFGGDGLRTMFVTGLRSGQSAEKLAAFPHSGGLYALDVGVAGATVGRFRDR